MTFLVTKAAKNTGRLKNSINAGAPTAWRVDYGESSKGRFYRLYTKPGFYGDSGNYSPLREIMNKANRHSSSMMVQLRTGHDALGCYFKKKKNCNFGKDTTNVDVSGLKLLGI